MLFSTCLFDCGEIENNLSKSLIFFLNTVGDDMVSRFIICIIEASKCTDRNLKSFVLSKIFDKEVCFEDLEI